MRYLKFLSALAMLSVACAAIGPVSAEEVGTKDEAVALVKRAIARVNAVGFDAAKLEFMDRNGKFFDRDLYIIGNSTGILLRKVIDRSRLSTSQRVDGTGRRHSLSRWRHTRGGQRSGHRGFAGRERVASC